MSYHRNCYYCDSQLSDSSPTCDVCGAKRGSHPSTLLPGVLTVLGAGGCFAFAVLDFFLEYPPGSKVTGWSKTGDYYYSTPTTIAITAGIPVVIGLTLICIDVIVTIIQRRSS